MYEKFYRGILPRVVQSNFDLQTKTPKDISSITLLFLIILAMLNSGNNCNYNLAEFFIVIVTFS